MSDLRARFGRRLRLGHDRRRCLIPGSGACTRAPPSSTAWWEVAAGVFSSDPGRSRAAGAGGRCRGPRATATSLK